VEDLEGEEGVVEGEREGKGETLILLPNSLDLMVRHHSGTRK